MDGNNKDFQAMMATFMENAKKMQENLQREYAQMAERNKDITVEAKAGGDLITVVVNLKMQIVRIDIKPQALTEKPQVLADLIAAAANEAIHLAQESVKQEMLAVSKKMGLPSDIPMPFKGE